MWTVIVLVIIGMATTIGKPTKSLPTISQTAIEPPQPPPAIKTKPIVDAMSLIGKNAKDVDAILGKCTHITKIENYPEDMPGEYRGYRPKGDDLEITVKMSRGQVTHINVQPFDIVLKGDLYELFGLDRSKFGSETKTGAALMATGTFNQQKWKVLGTVAKREQYGEWCLLNFGVTK